MRFGPGGTTLSNILLKIGVEPKQRVFEGPQRDKILQEMGSTPGTALEDIRFGKLILRYGDRCMFFETLLILVTWRLTQPLDYFDRDDELEWDLCIDFLRMKYGLISVTTDEDVLKGGKWFYLLAIYPGCPIN